MACHIQHLQQHAQHSMAQQLLLLPCLLHLSWLHLSLLLCELQTCWRYCLLPVYKQQSSTAPAEKHTFKDTAQSPDGATHHLLVRALLLLANDGHSFSLVVRGLLRVL